MSKAIDALPKHLQVEPCFALTSPEDPYTHHSHAVKHTLYKLWDALKNQPLNRGGLNDAASLINGLPFVTTASRKEAPQEISFLALSRFRADSSKFFFDIITRWLVPGKRLNIVLLHAVDVRLPHLSSDVFTLSEIIIKAESEKEATTIRLNWPAIENQLRLGLESDFYARRFLEIQGMSRDEKTSIIMQELAFLMKRLPHIFDQTLLPEIHYFLAVCSDSFKNDRTCRHLSRLIATQHFFRKHLHEAINKFAQKRYIKLKLFRVHAPSGNLHKRNILGLVVGVNLIKEKEQFENRHLLKAIQTYIPSARIIEDSFLSNRHNQEQMCVLYCEIEKGDSTPFCEHDIRLLRKELPRALEHRIEHMMHPVFMPRNEEDIYRNILMLSTQIKYLRDIPQMTITFDEQSHRHLFFTVIVVRVLKENDKSIQTLFQKHPSEIEHIHDRSQIVGVLRKTHQKEATVFRMKLQKDAFLRDDYTIDLNKARQLVVNEVTKVIGEVRDVNGGMIAKQNEVLKDLQTALQGQKGYNELLLENFFYSLTPVIARSVFDIGLLKALFLRLVEAIEDTADFEDLYSLKLSLDEANVYVVIKTKERMLQDELSKAIAGLKIHSSQLASMYLCDYDLTYIGYIYRQHNDHEQRRFCSALERTLASWKLKKQASTYFNFNR